MARAALLGPRVPANKQGEFGVISTVSTTRTCIGVRTSKRMRNNIQGIYNMEEFTDTRTLQNPTILHYVKVFSDRNSFLSRESTDIYQWVQVITSGSGEGISDNHSLLKRFLSSAMLGSMLPTPHQNIHMQTIS